MPGRIETVGGVLGAAVITTLASQGAQYVAIILYNRGTGDLNRNVLLGLSANIMVTALATASVPVIKELFIAAGIGFGALVFASGLLSDARALMAPKGGVAIFLATFNPFHLTHLDLVRRALDERRLDKVVIHPAIAPCLHVIALARGESASAGWRAASRCWSGRPRPTPMSTISRPGTASWRRRRGAS